MRHNTTYVLLGVTFALIGAGVIGTNLLTTEPSGISAQDTSPSAGFSMIGHVTYIVKDANGDIKAYRQTDNTVVNNGKDCVTKYLFQLGSTRGATSSAGTNCNGALTAPFNVIALGNGTVSPTIATTDYRLSHEAGGGNGLSRTAATSYTWTNATGTSSSTIVLSATFGPVSGIRSGGTQIVEAGLFNNTGANSTTGGMFAHQAISSITLNNGDSLTVNWTVNTG